MTLCKNLIAGVWTSRSGATTTRNPSDLSEAVGEYAQAGKDDVNAAVEGANSALPAWREGGIQARSELLDRIGDRVLSRREALGKLLSMEEGKTLAEGIGEVTRAGQVFKFYAGECLRMAGQSFESIRLGVDVEVTREPVGVVGIITPWNFPIAIPAWKVAPALAYGNTVVIKPAEITPGCVHALAEIIVECGCPAGVFNLVMGSGTVVGEALINHTDIHAVSFTGSGKVGRHVIECCAVTHKKVQTELGGKNPMVILDDADLSVAIPACINAAFYSTGQRCTATSRIIVERGISQEFTERFIDATEVLVVGNALEPQTQIGPVVSSAQLDSNCRYLQLAHEEGLKVLGGERLQLDNDGFFQKPGIFVGANNSMRTSREEIFGPFVSLIEAEDFEQALNIANDTEFGLSSGICTNSLKYSREFKRRSAAGMVMVNLPTAGVDYHVPFGGRKASSYGAREQGSNAMEFFTSIKTAYTYSP